MPTTEEPLWESTTVQNLIRYRPSGTYFARFKVGGKLVRKSLETPVFSVAKQRLPDKIREYRSRHESVKAFANGKMTVADAVEVYLGKVRSSVSLKPRSKDYRAMMIDFIGRSWPALFETDVRKVSDRDCENWLTRYQQQYAPTVVNNSIGTLRAVFDEAVGTGARFNNPAADLSRVKVRQKRLNLPSRSEFLRFVDEIRTAGARQSKDCANLVRFLAYSCVRMGEAKFVTWADVNFARHQLHVRGDPVTATKNGETRPHPDALFARGFLDLFDAAKLSKCCVSRFFMRHACGNVAFDQCVEMLPKLFGHFCFATRLSKEPKQAAKPSTKSWHRIQAPERTRLIPFVIRDQCSRSAANCLRPAVVNL